MTRWTPPGAHARADRQTLNRQIPQGIRYSLFLSLASCGFGRFQLTTNVLSSKKPCPLSYPPLSAYDLRARPRRPRPLLVRCHGAVGRRLRAASERVRLQSALSRPLSPSLPSSFSLSLFLSLYPILALPARATLLTFRSASSSVCLASQLFREPILPQRYQMGLTEVAY